MPCAQCPYASPALHRTFGGRICTVAVLCLSWPGAHVILLCMSATECILTVEAVGSLLDGADE
jgi:hypothetical protein